MTPLCLQLWSTLQHFNKVRWHFIHLAIISPLLCGHLSICCSKCKFSVVSVLFSHYAFTFQPCTFQEIFPKKYELGMVKKKCNLSWNHALRFKCFYFVFRFKCITLLIRATNSSVMRAVVTTKISWAQLKGAVPLKMLKYHQIIKSSKIKNNF